MTANDELLPCKVCRGKAQRVINYRAPCGVRCMVCGFEAKNEETWNHRNQPYTHEQVTQQSSHSEDVCKELVDRKALRALVEAALRALKQEEDKISSGQFSLLHAYLYAALTPFTQQQE